MRSLLRFASNKYSQNGEDGILAEIFKRLGVKSGWFVEFGAWDGKHMSNSYTLLESGWRGVDIEGEPERYQDLLKTAAKFPGKLHAIEAFIETKGKKSLDSLLSTTPVPKEFDLLSIDIDSYDWCIWESVKKYSPKVVVIEINSGFPVGVEQIHKPEDRNGSGSSFTSTLKLGQQKGYTLVCHTGNMLFVRNDLVTELKLPEDELQNPEGLFLNKWVDQGSLFGRIWRKLTS